ncbi:hypothetical protein [Amycolatopsis sp. NBC_00438]|uniref:hypothetical protein n=1 Tax=Amycolatopsis sp. NBC_00438 TaxID=2903558 RepID=UPI002E235120
MDAQTIVAITAAAISLAAMGVAIWQAREARSARRIASEQARTAQGALEETRTQTGLARDANTTAALSLDAAENAARSAQASADEARKANALTQRQHEREETARSAAALAHARKVTSRVRTMGAYNVRVTNDAHEAFYEIRLEHIEKVNSVDPPTAGWRLTKNNPRVRDRIAPSGGECDFWVEFLNEDGTPQPFVSGEGALFKWIITYVDEHGQRWERRGRGEPRPVSL